jgi:hypothetical protein
LNLKRYEVIFLCVDAVNAKPKFGGAVLYTTVLEFPGLIVRLQPEELRLAATQVRWRFLQQNFNPTILLAPARI